MPDVKLIYEKQFLPARNQEWMKSYLAAVNLAQFANENEFRSAEFQKKLWEIDGVSSIGPGAAVTVPGAYSDTSVIDALWALRNWAASNDPKTRAQHLDSEFQRILALVSPKHSPRRPSARLVRIFCVLRPYDIICLMDARRTAQFRQWLGLPRRGLGFIAQSAVARQALRDELGSESSLEDAVSYSQFAWFIWELIDGSDNSVGEGSSDALPSFATDAPKLVVLPAGMQRKGMFYVANNLQILLSLVRAAENGIDRENLTTQIGEEAPNLSRSSCQNVIAQAVSLNLLSLSSGEYIPTNSGKGLLEGEDPSDMMVPNFVRTVFGFALILAELSRAKQLTSNEVVKLAQRYYPRWKSDRAPLSLIAWLRDLRLITVQGSGRESVLRLTETGEYWVSGIPDDYQTSIQVFVDELVDELSVDDPIGLDVSPKLELMTVSADVLLRHFNDAELSTLIISEKQVQLVHAALHSSTSKRFILLAGLSGTGKTSLASSYARAYCKELDLPFSKHYVQVSVGPEWSDPSGLIGFVNPISVPPTFQETPALRLVIEASRNPAKPYFLCLDEMNLARVEHYFAPFLSGMEGENGRIALHSGAEAVDNIPTSVIWPKNLFIIGTVNMDETTFPFSDKVLDRAFTFEFWDVDLEAWAQKVAKKVDGTVLKNVTRVLFQLHGALVPARRHFGYRTCDEVLGFCSSISGIPFAEVLDAAVLAKVLPKIRGDSMGPLSACLAEVAKICSAEGLTQSLAKVDQMQKSLASLGVARFWA